ncbi:hypothetical protein [Mumia zhuanghuii]|uniref:Uncharacterized protein n=1 Tax=Mumia zhuanghuii TaxID=2585211 RepID=A0A5C4MCK5_9ACTN|nr:hypothetical protein [Mumia zhuanghuii]TNC33507.1 hypothetical protein FHE65_28880 [Mumia zhuanghuii]
MLQPQLQTLLGLQLTVAMRHWQQAWCTLMWGAALLKERTRASQGADALARLQEWTLWVFWMDALERFVLTG